MLSHRRVPRTTTSLLAALVLALLAAPAAQATVLYDVSVSGSQTLDWKFGGVLSIGACGSSAGDTPVTQAANGKGRVSFKFASAKPGLAVPSSFGAFTFNFSAAAKATGTMTGSMDYSNGRTGCSGFTPPADFSVPTSACGAQVFGLNIQAEWKSGFVNLTGDDDSTFAGARPNASAYANCPLPIGQLPLVSRAVGTSACERTASGPLWRRTNELNPLGRGLGSVRIAATPKSLSKPSKRVKTLSRRVQKHCVIPLHNSSSSIEIGVSTQMTITLKRR